MSVMGCVCRDTDKVGHVRQTTANSEMHSLCGKRYRRGSPAMRWEINIALGLLLSKELTRHVRTDRYFCNFY